MGLRHRHSTSLHTFQHILAQSHLMRRLRDQLGGCGSVPSALTVPASQELLLFTGTQRVPLHHPSPGVARGHTSRRKRLAVVRQCGESRLEARQPVHDSQTPLANLAYGPSAPSDGSLKGLSPSLTTYTTALFTSSAQSSWLVTQTATSLVTWVPTLSSSLDREFASRTSGGHVPTTVAPT